MTSGNRVHWSWSTLPITLPIPANNPCTPSLERIIREAIASGDNDRIAKIVHQLCHDYAYAVHQPHARNGGLIGLAAASIALGSVSTDQPPPRTANI